MQEWDTDMSQKLVIFWIGVFSTVSLLAASPESGKTASPLDAERLVILAADTLKPVEMQALGFSDPRLSPLEIDRCLHQACLFLEAALALDPENTEAWRQIYPLYMTDRLADPGRASQAVSRYVTLHPQDTQPLETWITWRLPQIQDRSGREEFLKQVLAYTQNDPVTRSRIFTQLGILAMEKGVYHGNEGAAIYFNQAVTVWQSNDDALARLIQLPPETPGPDAPPNASETQAQILQWQQILRWRSRLHNNPQDGQALLNLIDTLEQFNFPSIASRYYPVALNLLTIFPESKPLEYELRLKQIVNSYTLGDYRQCISLAQQALQDNPGDILLSGVLIRSFQKLDQQDAAKRWMEKTSRMILDKQASSASPDSSVFLEAAWYFSFIDPQPQQALVLAQSGQNDPEKHPRAQAVLAYAFLLNQRNSEAKQALSEAAPNDPIAVLTKASLELDENNPQAASDSLRSLPSNKWAVLDLQRDQLQLKIQKALNADSSTSPSTPVENPLEQHFAELLTRFYDDSEFSIPLDPEKSIHCSLRFAKDVFYFNDPIYATVHLVNTGQIELVLGPAAMIDPRVFIMAQVIPVTAGSDSALESSKPKNIPVTCGYLRQTQLLAPGQSNSIQFALNIGALRNVLQNHPQQAYRITFQLYLDPVSDGQGGWIGRIPKIQPQPVTVLRQAFRPTAKNLQFPMESLKQTAPEDNLRAAFLLAALVRQTVSDSSPNENAPLPSSVMGILTPLVKNFQRSDYHIRAWTAAAFQNQPLQVITPAINDLMQLLEDPHWFVRFMAIHTLDSYADLSQYHQFALTNETDPVVLRLIQWKLNQPWKTLELSAEQKDASVPEPSSPVVPGEQVPSQP